MVRISTGSRHALPCEAAHIPPALQRGTKRCLSFQFVDNNQHSLYAFQFLSHSLLSFGFLPAKIMSHDDKTCVLSDLYKTSRFVSHRYPKSLVFCVLLARISREQNKFTYQYGLHNLWDRSAFLRFNLNWNGETACLS